MTLHIAVIGIDGSGKSTLAQTLPMLMAAELNIVAGAAGDEFCVFGPDQDYMAPGFHPKGLPLAARLARVCRRLAKRFVDNPRVYPYLKLAHLMFQDDAAASIGRRYACDVVVSDCNLILSAMGRASNYRCAAVRSGAPRARSTARDLEAVFALLVEGVRLPEESIERLPSLSTAGSIASLARLLGFDGVWIPDVVIFLDVRPKVALQRIGVRGAKRDRHENEADMSRARETYLKALKALEQYRGKQCTHVIDVTDAEPRDVLRKAVSALRPHVEAHRMAQPAQVLGTPVGGTARSLLNRRYLLRYLLGKWFRGAWREPFFLLSGMGRQLLREGYSAGVMQAIYDQDEVWHGPVERAFLGYPLHRAVYDRLQILARSIESELEDRLERQRSICLFTAPSGFAYDLFRPLEAIASRRPELMRKVRLVAADLDPQGVIAGELAWLAELIGIDFRFIAGDIAAQETQDEFSRHGPYDMALFVGLSSWLPRPLALDHLRRLRSNLRPRGTLVTDCFSAADYSTGGACIGYRANYYSAPQYRCLLDYSGFDGNAVAVETGRDRINHVMVAHPLADARQPALMFDRTVPPSRLSA